MTDRPRSDRFGILVAVLGGLFVALATVLVVLLVSSDGADTTTTAAAGTTVAETTAPPSSTTEATTTTTASTTTATTTTTTAATTTTTTAAPFAGDLFDKTGPVQGTPAGRLVEIRSADHPGYARVVFDFPAGGIPGYWIGYTSATTLTVILYPMDWGSPYEPGIFDGGGTHPVATGSITAVRDGGMGGGSGEWGFEIVVTSQKPFLVGTLDGPPRIYVDVGD